MSESEDPAANAVGESSPSERLHHVDAVHFVHHAIKHAIRDKSLHIDGQISSEGLCRILLELSVDEFGADGKDVLIGWNVVQSEDVGLIVARMLEAGIEEANSVHQAASFDGFFDLHEPPENWKLRWD